MKISTVLYVPSPYPARGKMVLPQHWRRSSNGVNGVGNAKCGVDGLESLQECHFYSVFFPLLFPILVDFCFHFWWILFPRLSRGQFHKCQNFTRTPKATLDRNFASKSLHYKGYLLGFSSFVVFTFNV